MILRDPSYNSAIVITDALDTDSSLFLLALSAFGSRVFAMATSTALAHLERIIWGEILATSFDRASTKRWDGGGQGGRRLKVDVIWVVAHPDAGGAGAGARWDTHSERRSAAVCHNPPSEL